MEAAIASPITQKTTRVDALAIQPIIVQTVVLRLNAVMMQTIPGAEMIEQIAVMIIRWKSDPRYIFRRIDGLILSQPEIHLPLEHVHVGHLHLQAVPDRERPLAPSPHEPQAHRVEGIEIIR